ncbi:membrane dipeptidase [Butyricicoccus faecihominis]|uniref:dipeptidase n=1 Tax=Butyricicoccus faecihominis TaxID=1712515 RepID=UPI002478A41E|nr:membrane dipeptidase [Butyricicoccus faecihominis]MCQ5131184.1 membrane dipeptidase [Butyricicoccus faecihominis]
MKLFDLHCDTIYECCETGKALRENDLHVNLAGARRYTHYAQFFALFCGARAPSAELAAGRASLLDTPPNERFARMVKTAMGEFEKNADWLTFCRTSEDLARAAADGKAAAFLSVEGAELLPDTPDGLDLAYDAGVRLLTLTWNYRSKFGCPASVDQAEGLTEEGRKLVRDCEQKGIIVDVSHLSEQGFWDVCETAAKPFVATHSDSRALCRHPRNLTDRQFAAIVSGGGLVGVNLYTPFLVRQSDSVLEDALDHIEHFLGLYGEGHLALGCDLDGCDELPAGVGGLGDLYKLGELMLRKGYKESTVNGLFYDNAFAFIEKML